MDKPIRILVVEDDDDISQLLCNILRKSGYSPQPAFSGTEALLYLETERWHMILLDLMLPGMSGEELLVRIQRHSSAPVIIISAKGEQRTKVDMLRSGADDYITKPFDVEEVSARIDSHLRRYLRSATDTENHLLQHKNVILDLDAKTVVVKDQRLSLTPHEFDILALLMKSPKKLFTKENIFESVWGEPLMGDEARTINVHISNLRSKLAKVDPAEEYIETIWGMGYRLKP
ncbi:response regulator transcription factor [Alicyclobacillus shizuokensis]|uniref:response regulator transcription factor n=1 Tax=Alicyclobacillus shizuokensis TaxID=392014 RepID=UPI0008295712|nr:response regulator transcription factor [Alicyclobacillus shizuokensis]MCL6626910.1 response regulator transcription factor [Alicyclobacillus shizuokensis]